jgi:hypothetical protein
VQVELPRLQSREHHVAVDLMAYADDASAHCGSG